MKKYRCAIRRYGPLFRALLKFTVRQQQWFKVLVVLSRSFVLVGEALSVDPESRFYRWHFTVIRWRMEALALTWLHVSWSTTSTDAYTKTPTILHNILIIRKSNYRMQRTPQFAALFTHAPPSPAVPPSPAHHLPITILLPWWCAPICWIAEFQIRYAISKLKISTFCMLSITEI